MAQPYAADHAPWFLLDLELFSYLLTKHCGLWASIYIVSLKNIDYLIFCNWRNRNR